MTGFQECWWEQARSDHLVFVLLREEGVEPCHLLHYLQMVVEKLAKAYRWRTGTPPVLSHASFVIFLKMLISRTSLERERIALRLGFPGAESFKSFIRASAPLAYDIERLAPTLAGDGPNPEYPLPHHCPNHAPATHDFDVWNRIINTAAGRQLLTTIRGLVDTFPSYA